jgi:hypothetical protein
MDEPERLRGAVAGAEPGALAIACRRAIMHLSPLLQLADDRRNGSPDASPTFGPAGAFFHVIPAPLASTTAHAAAVTLRPMPQRPRTKRPGFPGRSLRRNTRA